jgi:hypothetical protein
MKSKTKAGIHRFPLNLLHYGNNYYLDRLARLEKLLARRPRRLQLDLIGEGEISAEWAMLFRETLGRRSPKTRLITDGRSTLKNGSVLVWLAGDERRLAPHARLFFRKATVMEEPEGVTARVWNEEELKYSESEADPDEIAQVRLLQYINEYLPAKELAGKVIDEATLRQFGLMENEKLDSFLATAFSRPPAGDEKAAGENSSAKTKTSSVPTQK